MFKHQAILIVEDEPFVALELLEAVERMGGRPVGPVATVAEALVLIETMAIDAAILDVQLANRDITPVALRLIAMGKPLIFQTGTGLPPSLREAADNLPVLRKPVAADIVLANLSTEMKRRAPV
ncbi:MAG: response regulator [Sphingopyxis sp.]|uniref:response regulator n=1 Tax=Sphingopyxis sp. TaxID=1908224 RepID=UPI003D80D327